MSENDPQYAMEVVRVPNFPVHTKMRELEKEFFPNGVTSEQIKLLDRVGQLLHEAFKTGHDAANVLGPAETWSNHACLGYAIMAAQSIKWSPAKISELTRSIHYEFDMKTIEEAKEHYEHSRY